MRILTPVLLAVFVALLLSACFEESAIEAPSPAAPNLALATASPPDAYYPMTPGNRWTYRSIVTTQFIPDDGPSEPPVVEQTRVDVEQVGYETNEGRPYLRQTFRYSDSPVATHRLFRQDSEGFYMSTVRIDKQGNSTDGPVLSATTQDVARIAGNSGVDVRCVEHHLARIARVRNALGGPGCVPEAEPLAGVLSSEIQILAYPLQPGTTWVVRDQPFESATVENQEQFLGFGSYRVGRDDEFLDEDDWTRIWYSSCGEVGRRIHISSVAYSPGGTPIGLFVYDESVDLIALDIGVGGCSVRGGGDGGIPARDNPKADADSGPMK